MGFCAHKDDRNLLLRYPPRGGIFKAAENRIHNVFIFEIQQAVKFCIGFKKLIEGRMEAINTESKSDLVSRLFQPYSQAVKASATAAKRGESLCQAVTQNVRVAWDGSP